MGMHCYGNYDPQQQLLSFHCCCIYTLKMIMSLLSILMCLTSKKTSAFQTLHIECQMKPINELGLFSLSVSVLELLQIS